MFVISGVSATSKVYCISKSKRYFSRRSSTYYFQIKTKILADFQICISVPLIGFSGSTSTTTHFSITMKRNILVINCMSEVALWKKLVSNTFQILLQICLISHNFEFVSNLLQNKVKYSDNQQMKHRSSH